LNAGTKAGGTHAGAGVIATVNKPLKENELALDDRGEVARLLGGWGRLWGVADLAQRVRVERSARLSASLGLCYPLKGRIALNPVLFKPANRALLIEVLCHEAAHMAARLLARRRIKPHGPEWRRLMRMAGYEPRVRIAPHAVFGYKRVNKRRAHYLYRHTCTECGARFTARRTDHRWRCAACYDGGSGGMLKVVRSPRAA